MNTIEHAWETIENWLDANTKHYDRSVIATGATTEQLEIFEDYFQVQMPHDFCTSYLLHNGFKEKIGLFHGANLLSLAEIRQHFNRLLFGKSTNQWDLNMLPVLMYNAYDFICFHMKDKHIYTISIDDTNGTIDSKKLPFASFSAIIQSVADDLQKGNGSMGELLC